MFAISWCLYAEAYLAAPILIRRGFTPTGRHAFIMFAIAMGTYMGWIGILFLQDVADHGARHGPGVIGIAQLGAVGIADQFAVDAGVEEIAWHGSECGTGL